MTVIEAAGLVAMPGIIDTHSHIAIQGGVNEFSLSVVPEVRVKDVVTGDDVSIYRALAGGTTTARLLHGSANTIGGQDAVIKLRYGKPGRDLIIRDAPQGVKFALGENVTRLARPVPQHPDGRRGGDRARLRGGQGLSGRVGAPTRKRARKKPGEGRPCRRARDLRLEALARILEGTIKIHSHCYRSDEILMLLRTAERYGVRVQSLQHVLEGYKVAAEIAEHGASASTFSDWWAYKVEAYDAIPFNAALLTQAGANVCIKSDSEELIRHLNLEAAKMVKYGGVSEAQALAMITINPARELGLEQRLGSIEVGKDADIALFNGHPFDAFSRCELALIDGEVYFQRPEPDGKFARPSRRSHARCPRRPTPRGTTWSSSRPSRRGSSRSSAPTLHPVTGPVIPNGTLVVSSGKIAAVGTGGHSDSARGPDDRPRRPGRLARPDRRGLDDRPLRDRQPARDPGLRRRQPVRARAPGQHGAAAGLRAHPGHPRQRRPDGLRPAGRRADLGPGLRDRPSRLGSPRAGHRRSRRPQRDDPRVHLARSRRARVAVRPGPGRQAEARPGPPGPAERAARSDPGAVPQGVAVWRRRGSGPGQGRRRAAPSILGWPPWFPMRRARSR